MVGNVSDEKPCQENATSMNGLFCSLHSKQCQALYQGYKKRNTQLDKLSENPPEYLADSKTSLINQLFADAEKEELCKEIHDHLLLKLQLLERVIRARKLHHSRFFHELRLRPHQLSQSPTKPTHKRNKGFGENWASSNGDNQSIKSGSSYKGFVNARPKKKLIGRRSNRKRSQKLLFFDVTTRMLRDAWRSRGSRSDVRNRTQL